MKIQLNDDDKSRKKIVIDEIVEKKKTKETTRARVHVDFCHEKTQSSANLFLAEHAALFYSLKIENSHFSYR